MRRNKSATLLGISESSLDHIESLPMHLRLGIKKNFTEETMDDVAVNNKKEHMHQMLDIVVLGASGDLAKKKTYPSFFDLYLHGFIPESTVIVGYARSSMTDEAFRDYIRPFLTADTEDLLQKRESFVSKCYYFSGQYDSSEAFAALGNRLNELEELTTCEQSSSNRLFYFAVPPNVFIPAAQSIKANALTSSGWNRLIVEKPFGHDLKSAKEMLNQLSALYNEDQIYRIDHYLGKEMVQNLLMFRFANIIFEPLLNNRYVQCVTITFKEDFGTDGRGGYFDKYGIIRDIMQNHLLQVMSLIAMEAPVSIIGPDSPNLVRDAKVNALRAIHPIKIEDVIIGQYVADDEGKNPGYLDDPTVDPNSTTATYALVVMYVNTPRWAGVPFIMKAGKALDNRKAEVRIQYKDTPGLPFMFDTDDCPRNELVMRLQPEESVYMKMMVKKPGLFTTPIQSELDLNFVTRHQAYRPEAYTRLLLDATRGNQSGFVRGDELEMAWRIFSPVLEELEAKKIKPLPYKFGSRGPPEADERIAQLGYKFDPNYEW
eukprot:CAMPEP_0182423458 /NCGR_PEP_ID=MMETSP1167-20130531/9469_1 /TAXON_ID=2988 /ORGANISM="Mallomonas Sp, Strain CCMP3275" /LENGTH=542 /DNA_ID=CAMNT_0024602467 /DNA_START=76 /DNA_END=1701 /DNA_ORIENTATION=-